MYYTYKIFDEIIQVMSQFSSELNLYRFLGYVEAYVRPIVKVVSGRLGSRPSSALLLGSRFISRIRSSSIYIYIFFWGGGYVSAPVRAQPFNIF